MSIRDRAGINAGDPTIPQLLEGLLAPPEWYLEGLCAQTDPDAFYPENGGSTREAKNVCLSCPVRPNCLEYALGNEERHGVWGGLSERERRRLVKDRRLAVPS